MEDIFYEVRNGDTLFKIAQAYQVPINVIARANNLRNQNEIYVGQVLRIPQLNTRVWYIVRYGDTLFNIAKRFFTTVDNIVALNNIPNPDDIRAGQRIRVR